MWLFITPVVYPSSQIAEPWRTLSAINPMVGVVEGFRWALLDTQPAPGPMLFASSGIVVVLLATGFIYFRRAEAHFADVI